MKKNATPISEVVKSVFTQIEKTKTVSKEEMDAMWEEAAGAGAAKHSRPNALKKKVLMVRVDTSGWLQNLVMRKREILKGLKRTVGKDKISEIQFKIGEF